MSSDRLKIFHDYSEFSLLVKTVMSSYSGYQRVLLRVDDGGQLYFLDKKSTWHYLSPKNRDKFLEDAPREFDYHYDVLD